MASSISLPLYPRPARDNSNALIADQRLAVSSGVVNFTAYTPAQADVVVLDIQTNDVMCTFDGTSPSNVNGHQLIAGEKYTWNVDAFNTAKFIRLSADGSIHASAFRI